MANRTSEIAAEEVPGSPLRRSSRIATASPVPVAAAITGRRRSSASAEPTFPAAAKLTRTKRLSLSHETGDDRPSTPTKLTRARAGSKSPSQLEGEKAPGTPSKRTRRSSVSKIIEEEPEELSPTRSQGLRSTRSQSKSPERPKRGRPSMAGKQKKLEAIEETESKSKTEPKTPSTRGRRGSLSTRRGSTDIEAEDKTAKQIPETKKVTRRSTRATSVDLEEVEENKTKIDLKAIEEDIEHEIIEKEESSKNVRKKSLNDNEDDKAKLNDKEKEGRRSLNKNQVKSPMGEKDETKISKNEDSAKTEKDETKISENEDSAKTPEEQLTLKIDEDNKPSNVEEVKSQSAAAEDTSVQISNQSQDSKSNTPIKAKLEQSKNMPKIEEQSAKNTPQKVNLTPIKSNLDGSKNSPKIGEQSSKNTSQTVNLTPIKSNLDESKNSPKVEEQSSKNTLQKVNLKSNLDGSKNSPKVEEQRSENIPQKVNLTPIKPNLDQSPKIVEQSPKNLCNKLELTPKVLLNRNVVEKDFKKSITPTRNIQTDKIEPSKSGSEKKRKLSLISTEENSKQLMPEVSGTSLATTDIHSTSLKTQEFETTSPQILDETILDSNNDEKDSLQKSLEEDDANILKMCLKIESDKSNDEAHDKLDSKEMDEDATETNDQSTKGVSDKDIKNTTDLKHDKSLSEVETDFIAKKNSSSLQGDIKELNESQAVVNISKIVELDVSKTNSTKISDTNESREIIDDHNKSHEKVLNVSKNENIISKSETPLKKRKLSTSINEDNKNKSFKSPKTQTQKPDSSLLGNECEMTCGSDGSFHLILSIAPSDNSQDTESDMKKEETLNSSTGSNSSDKENVNASPAKAIKPLKQINTSNTSTPKTDVLKSTSFSEKGGEIIVNPVVTTTDNVLRKSLSKSFDASRPEEKKKTDKDSDSIIETVAVDDDEQLNDLLDSFVDEVKDDENNESNLNIKEVKKTEEKLDNKVIELEEETTKQEKSFAKKRSDDENNESNLNIKEVKKTDEKLDNKVKELEEETTKQEKSFAKKRSKRRKIVISEEEDDEISSDDEDVDEEEEQSFINLGDVSDSEDEEDRQSSNPFIDDQAFEGEEDTPSEDSNQIIERGESINSEDTDDESDDEDYENDSFIVDDDDLELLSSDEIDEFKKEKVKKKTRIIQVSDSDSEEDIPVLVVDSAEEEEKKINIIQDVKISAGKSKVVINEKDNSMNLEILKLDVDEESKKLNATPTILQDYKRTRKASLTISDIDLSQLPEGMINEKITKAVDLICSTIKSSGNVSLNISIDYDNESNDGGKKVEVVELQPEQSEKIDEVNQSQDKLNRKSMKRVSLSPSKAQSRHGDTMNISKVQPDEVEGLNISELQGDTDKLKRRSKKRDSSALDTSSREKSPTKARSAYDVSVTQEEADEDEILNITQSQADTAKLKRRSKKRDSGKFEKSLVRAISEDGILSQSVLEANEDKPKERSEKRDSLERRRSKSHSFYEENSSPNKRNDPETIDDEIDVKMKKSKLKKRDSLKNITHEDFKSDFEVEYVTSPLEKAKLKEALNNTEELTVESPKENNTKKKSKRRQSTYFEMNEDEEPCSSTTVKGVNTFEVQNVSSPPKKSKSSKRMSLQDEFEIEDSKVEIVQQKKRKTDKINDEIIPGKKSKKIKGELKPVEIKKNKSKKKDKISPYTNLDYIPQTDFEEKVASPQKANVSEVKSKKMKHVSVKPSQVRQISGWEVEEADMARPSLKNEKKSEQQSYFEQISAKDFKNKMIFDPSRIKRTNAKKLLKSKAKMLMSNR